MTATKSISVFPPSPVQHAKTQNNDDALAEIVRSLSGNAATLHGHIVGGDSLDTATINAAPLNPGSSQRGHDHSGGLYGSPLFRTVASLQLADTSTYGTIATNDGLQTFDIGSLSSTDIYIATVPVRAGVWVPGCDPGPLGAYSRLGLRVLWYVSSGGGLKTDDILRLRVQNSTTGSQVLLDLDGFAAAPSGDYTYESASTERLLMRPGALNQIAMRAEFETSATAGTRTLVFTLSNVEFGVYTTNPTSS